MEIQSDYELCIIIKQAGLWEMDCGQDDESAVRSRASHEETWNIKLQENKNNKLVFFFLLTQVDRSLSKPIQLV